MLLYNNRTILLFLLSYDTGIIVITVIIVISIV